MSEYSEHLISMAGGDGDIADIESRLNSDRDDFGGGWSDHTIQDRAYLLALVREQAAKLKRVEALADKLETFAANTRGFNPTRHAGWDGKASDYDRQARAIRAALEATK